jgi:hypothetical protein
LHAEPSRALSGEKNTLKTSIVCERNPAKNDGSTAAQGCQISLVCTIYQNGKKYTNRPHNTPNGHYI